MYMYIYIIYIYIYFSVIHFSVGKNLSVVTLQGEVFTGPLSNPLPSLLDLKKIPNIQQTSKVFTDFKNANLAVLQNIYRYTIII